MKGYNEYAVYMQWDSYEGSLFVETSTTWVFALSSDEAKSKACNQFDHNKGFKIVDVCKIK